MSIPANNTSPDAPLRDSNPFLQNAREGRHGIRWFLTTTFFVLICWQVIGAIPYLIAITLGWSEDPLISFIALNSSFVVLLASLVFAMHRVHHRHPLTLVSPDGSFSLRRALTAGSLWFVITLLSCLLDAVVHPGSYHLSFNPADWLLFLPAAIILIPIQAGSEELLFRGYFLQQTAFLSKNKWGLATLSGIIFAVPHFFNPEMQQGFFLTALFYFAFGWVMAMVTIISNRLEYALGIHIANNLTTVLIANYTGSALPSPAIFTAGIVDPSFNLLAFLGSAALLWILLFHLLPSLNKPKGSS